MNDYCDCCGEMLKNGEPRYVFPGGFVICEECVDEWVDDHYREEGVIDLDNLPDETGLLPLVTDQLEGSQTTQLQQVTQLTLPPIVHHLM